MQRFFTGILECRTRGRTVPLPRAVAGESPVGLVVGQDTTEGLHTMGTYSALKQLFRYEIVGDRPVGRGGCGHIWKAKDLLFDRPVALKTLGEPLIWDYPEKGARAFRKEAMACARLSEVNPHIVKVFDIGLVDGVLFYAMQWFEPQQGYRSVDLSERAGKLTLAAVKGMMFQVCEAVSAAHARGIVHSDIAPNNILYDATNRMCFLADFGLLKIIEEQLVSRGSGSLLVGGRLDYLPQEVHRDVSRVGYGTDVYALGVTFRVLLEGTTCLPAEGGRLLPTPGAVRVRAEQRDAPDQVRQLLYRFLDQHKPTDSVDEFVAVLRRIPN